MVIERVNNDTLKLGQDGRAVRCGEFEFAPLDAMSFQGCFQVCSKNLRTVLSRDKTGKGRVGQLMPFNSEHARAGKIYLPYYSARIKCKIANGCKVIQLGIFIPRNLKFLPGLSQFIILQLQFDLLALKLILGPAQFRILNLQLDLVDLEFMVKSLLCQLGPGWLYGSFFFRQWFFCVAIQF